MLEFKVKWKGYPMTENTWKPIQELKNAKELVEAYKQTHAKKIEKDIKDKMRKLKNCII